MTIAIIILAYVANIFLNRWLNKIIYNHDERNEVLFIASWFLSLACTFGFLMFILANDVTIKKKNDTFID